MMEALLPESYAHPYRRSIKLVRAVGRLVDQKRVSAG